MTRFNHRRSRRLRVALVAGAIVLGAAALASADGVGPITFEAPGYHTGNINGQNGWTKTGPYDAAAATVAAFPAASGYGFGAQALRISDAATSGGFGDQTFAPAVATPAGESLVNHHFEAAFSIGTTQATQQPGLHLSVSPDDGQGSRMSYLRFEDQSDGVHVFFVDVTDPGPKPTTAEFNETDIATLSRARAHRIRFSMDLRPGPANDVVRIVIDGRVKRLHGAQAYHPCTAKRGGHHLATRCDHRTTTGTTWEDYYRYDPEQAGNGNVVPVVRTVLFLERGSPTPANVGQGFLIDRLSFASSNPPATGRDCRHGGWKIHTRLDGSAFASRRACLRYVKRHGASH